MNVRRKLVVVAVAAAVSSAVVVTPALAATTPLPVDLTGPSVFWNEFDNWIMPESSVLGCTSLQHRVDTGDYLSGYGPSEANSADQTDGFDTYALVTVDGDYFINPDDDVDVADNTVTSDTRTMGGVDVTIEHAALQTQPVLRTLVELTNRGATEVTKTVTIEQDLGSDSSTWIQATSSGDTAWTVADRWSVTTEDDEADFGDPVITTALFGPGQVAVPPVSLDLCGELWDTLDVAVDKTDDTPGSGGGVAAQGVYSEAAQTSAAYFSVTIPAGETRYLAFFNSATTDSSLAPALAVTTLYDAGLTGDLATGLDPAILPYVVNWSTALPVVIEPTFTG